MTGRSKGVLGKRTAATAGLPSPIPSLSPTSGPVDPSAWNQPQNAYHARLRPSGQALGTRGTASAPGVARTPVARLRPARHRLTRVGTSPISARAPGRRRADLVARDDPAGVAASDLGPRPEPGLFRRADWLTGQRRAGPDPG